MSSLNKVILIGRLGKDPAVRYTSGGQAVANVSIATDESYKNAAGEKVKKTEWINLVIWGKAVESFVQPYLHSGDLVYVEGKLQTRSWEDKKSGTTKYTTEVNVSDIKSLQPREGSAAPATSAPKTQGMKARPAPAASEIDDSDIPF